VSLASLTAPYWYEAAAGVTYIVGLDRPSGSGALIGRLRERRRDRGAKSSRMTERKTLSGHPRAFWLEDQATSVLLPMWFVKKAPPDETGPRNRDCGAGIQQAPRNRLFQVQFHSSNLDKLEF